MTTGETPLLSRFVAEIAAALFTGALGVAVVVGALEYGVGWSEYGPEPGAFPFYVGVIIVGASLVNLVQALRHRFPDAVFLDRTQALRVLAFFGPMALFALAAVFLGLYVATALYLGAVMRLQGGYRLAVSIAVGIGAAVFFYVVLEMWFQVPLLKGPLEPLLGIY